VGLSEAKREVTKCLSLVWTSSADDHWKWGLELARKEAAVGDEVCILFREDVPFVLRPTVAWKEFRFMGDCYVPRYYGW
jgi:hypothetical protein